MIAGLDGPVVVLDARVAALIVRPLERLVAEARRRGEPVDPGVVAALGDCERVRRALVAQAATVPQTEPAEPGSAEPGAHSVCDPDLSAKDAAAWLDVSPSYVRRLAREHRLGLKVGGTWRFPVAELVLHRDTERA